MKSKKILTILLSLAIMFTFMPAMAFADSAATPTVEWEKDFVSAKVNGTPIAATWEFQSSGLTKATVSFNNSPVSVRYFYNFNSASFDGLSAMDADTYKGLNKTAAKFTLKDPAGKVASKVVTDGKLTGWTINYVTDQEATSGTYDVTAKAVLDSTNYNLSEMDGQLIEDKYYPAVVGLDNLKQTVGVTPKASIQTSFYDASDSTKKAVTTVNTNYGGTEVNLVTDDVDGYSRTYQKFENGTWVDVTSVSYKDVVGDEDTVNYRAVYKQTALNPAYTVDPLIKSVSITIKGRSNAPSYKWTTSNSEYKYNNTVGTNVYYLTEAQAADPSAFVEVVNNFADANKQGVDLEEIKAYFNDRYEVAVSDNKIDPSIKTWTIKEKANYAKDLKKDVDKKYAQLFKNYKTAVNGLTLSGDASVNVVVASGSEVNTKDDDISFEGQTSFTYSGKKTTKKGVLKAKKTITVKATADSGNAITYVATKTAGGKITVSAAGKITVKKGLKKGTYKVTVKAKTAAGNGYKAASEKQTYVIKIKK